MPASTSMPAVPNSGELVRLLRQRKKLTLDQLAVDVGLSKGHLSRYERGEKSLSVSSLMRLAKALGTSVSALLGEAAHDEAVHVVEASARTRQKAPKAEGSYEFIPLSRPGDVDSSAFIARFSQSAEMRNAAYHGGEEMLFVVSGSVEVKLPTRSVLLRQGDFAQFPGSMPHRLRGLERDTEVLIVVAHGGA